MITSLILTFHAAFDIIGIIWSADRSHEMVPDNIKPTSAGRAGTS
jgi:hypothetical protein